MLFAPAQGPLGLELFAARPQIVEKQLLLGGGLLTDLLSLSVQVDEDADLRFQDQGLDWLEDIIDRACRVATEDVDVLFVVGGEEQDRDPGGPRAAPDQCSDLVTVHAGHLHVEENQREVFAQAPPEGLLRRIHEDEVEAGLVEHLRGSEQVASVIVDDKDFRADEGQVPDLRHPVRGLGARQRIL